MNVPSQILRASAAAIVAALMLAACGSADGAGGPVTDPDYDGASDVLTTVSDTTVPTTDAFSETSAAAITTPPKPDVEIPDELPTELVITDLIEGTGDGAEVGDTVTVHYVGVRSEDGTEFDNSYDRGAPFPVVLGTNSVIQGWEQGLIGVKAGGRRQLDIPAALAYGDADRGTIRPGDALTFVIDVVSVEKPPVITAPPMADPADCPAVDGSEPQVREFTEMQPFCIDVTKTYVAEVATNFGDFTIELQPDKAPQNVNNFVVLARYHYFDDTECHRVLTDFVVQCGDPQGDGYGGPGYTIPDELPQPGQYQAGSLAMANTGQPNSAGSQFFIITGSNGVALPPQYSLFGEVIGGYDPTIVELNTLENPDGVNGTPPLETITIESVTITES